MNITFSGRTLPPSPRPHRIQPQPRFSARTSPWDRIERAVKPFRETQGVDETGKLAEILENPEKWRAFQEKCLGPFSYSYSPRENKTPAGGIHAATLVKQQRKLSNTEYKTLADSYNNLIKALGIEHRLSPLDLNKVGVVFFLLRPGEKLKRITETPNQDALLFEVGKDPDQKQVSWHLMTFPIQKLLGSSRGHGSSREDGTQLFVISQSKLSFPQRLGRAFRAFKAVLKQPQSHPDDIV